MPTDRAAEKNGHAPADQATRETAAVRHRIPTGAQSRGLPKVAARRVERFLRELERTGNVTMSADLSGLPRRVAYRMRSENPDFAAQWDSCRSLGFEALEDEAIRRAAVGYERPIYQGGKLVGTERVFSDVLMDRVLRARKPELYRDPVAAVASGGDFLALLMSLPPGGKLSVERQAQTEPAPKTIEALDRGDAVKP
jgi:hypothetical protein